MIAAAGSEPGPGGVGPGAVIRAGCADRGGGGQGQRRVGLGHGGPGTRSGLAVSLAEQPVRLSGKFLGAAVMLRSGHRCSTCLIAWPWERYHALAWPWERYHARPGDSPTVACPPRKRGQKPSAIGARARCKH